LAHAFVHLKRFTKKRMEGGRVAALESSQLYTRGKVPNRVSYKKQNYAGHRNEHAVAAPYYFLLHRCLCYRGPLSALTYSFGSGAPATLFLLPYVCSSEASAS
jgi:hypothetical protein